MIRASAFAMIAICIVLLSPAATAQNLLKYRDFEFGVNVETVLKETKTNVSSAMISFAVPDLIQTLR